MKKKYYKTTIKIEVLSEEPIPEEIDLQEIVMEGIDGEYSLEWEIDKVEELTKKQIIQELENQGSDASFFMLD